MPQFIAAAALAVANAAQVAVVAAGVSTTAAAFVGTALYSATELAIYVGISAVAAKVLAPSLPKPGSTQVPLRQSFSPRRSAFGLVRTSGVYALFEAVDKLSVDVLALHDGEIDGFERYYLNDDRVELGSGGPNGVISPDGVKYPATVVWIYTRAGLATETAYAEVTAIDPAWDTAHRGDGVASLALVCKQTKAKHMSDDFPNGLPIPSAAYRAQKVYDPRDGDQVQGDKSTYVWSANPALATLAYMTDAAGGMKLDYASRILPNIDYWIAAADDCDAAEATADGTEARYRIGLAYDHDNAPAEVIGAHLESFDGWLTQIGNGAFLLRSGRYEAPTVTIQDRHVLSYTLTHFQPDEQAVNEIVATYVDPDSEFTEVDAGAVRDEADIAARGVVRSQKVSLAGVPSATQAYRIARRRLDRATQPVRGSITTNLWGLNALGERFVQLQISDNAALSDLVVEITDSPKIDLANLSLTFPFVAANPAIDDGDPGAEVSAPGAPDPRPGQAPLEAPSITALAALYDDSAAEVAGARIEATVAAPDIAQADAQWKLRWRKAGDTNWTEGQYDDIDDGASVELVTGFVAATGDLEVQVAYQLASGTSPWSSTATITLSTPSVFSQDLTASQDLAAGDLVNIHTVAGASKMRLADADDTTKPAHGFVKAAVANGALGAFYGPGQVNDAVAGLTPGATYWLSTVAGGLVAAAPSTTLNGQQEVGQALSATKLLFAPKMMVEAP